MALRVGSWPGYGPYQNSFLTVFLRALEDAGCDVVSLENVEEIGRKRDIDIILLHWPQAVFWESKSRRMVIDKMLKLLRLLDARASSTKAVWLAHDLVPHDARGLQRILWKPFLRALARRLDGVLTLAPRTVPLVLEAVPSLARKPAGFVWHPSYPGAALSAPERYTERRELDFEPEHKVLGYCGQIRANKRVDALVRVFRNLRDPSARLLIAGKPMGAGIDVASELEMAASEDPRIRLRLEDLSQAGFRRTLGACDWFVAPFGTYTHSGSLIHALSANVPILTPTTPYALSLQDEIGSSWVRLYDGPLTTDVLRETLRLSMPHGAAPMAAFAPKAVGVQAATWLRGAL